MMLETVKLLEDKPDDCSLVWPAYYNIIGAAYDHPYYFVLEYKDKEFPSKLEALRFAKGIEEIVLDHCKGKAKYKANLAKVLGS